MEKTYALKRLGPLVHSPLQEQLNIKRKLSEFSKLALVHVLISELVFRAQSFNPDNRI